MSGISGSRISHIMILHANFLRFRAQKQAKQGISLRHTGFKRGCQFKGTNGVADLKGPISRGARHKPESNMSIQLSTNMSRWLSLLSSHHLPLPLNKVEAGKSETLSRCLVKTKATYSMLFQISPHLGMTLGNGKKGCKRILVSQAPRKIPSAEEKNKEFKNFGGKMTQSSRLSPLQHCRESRFTQRDRLREKFLIRPQRNRAHP